MPVQSGIRSGHSLSIKVTTWDCSRWHAENPCGILRSHFVPAKGLVPGGLWLKRQNFCCVSCGLTSFSMWTLWLCCVDSSFFGKMDFFSWDQQSQSPMRTKIRRIKGPTWCRSVIFFLKQWNIILEWHEKKIGEKGGVFSRACHGRLGRVLEQRSKIK